MKPENRPKAAAGCVPSEIIHLAAEATGYQDEEAKQKASERLIEVRDYINNALGVTYQCVRCGRELVVLQHLDYVNLPEGRVCMPCMGGS